ncbi:MAG: cell division protein ZapE [Paracoccus sp. (in: a-proteobacteria)]|jgi:cell division protein ZapE|uniref:cell division protein ZapE n=1 Tax=unclassified Paracoccus (in: a-proteobacteria) TaxID=2688777 RepID=UPI001891DCA1|nr:MULTISPECIES: cell division protein ZapE [unclassified Paracoccus (in: a-proteobacteria)]MBF5079791.1 AFG1 family ATPase [Paracoccus sp. NBH48]
MGKVSDLYRQRIASGALRHDDAQAAVLPHMDRVLDQLQATPPQKPRSAWRAFLGVGSPDPVPAVQGLYLWGGVGRGKSMLMDLMADAAGDIPTRRVHFHEFMQEIQAGLNEARKRGEQDTVRPVAEAVAAQVRLLCFDEMQITDIADAMIVGRLFQVLFDQGVTVVTTSNREPDDLYKHGLNRQLFLPFIALIRQRMEVVCLDSRTDYRQNRQGGQVWFAPADAAARAELDAVWAELTGDATPEPLVLTVQGRQVTLPAHVGRAARSSFWDLCGKPLGPADYLAVARAVDVLLIDGVPRLSASNYNEAKRFVTLIDALYEARVRLIASGADQPEQLYNEGEGSFEFERTASRLREMQDAAWGRRDPAGD